MPNEHTPSAPGGPVAPEPRDAVPRAPAPRRRHALLLIPALVAVGFGGLLVITAGATLRAPTPVQVRPALFDRAAEGAEPPGDANAPGAPPGSGVVVQAPGWLEAEPYLTACTALIDGVVRTVEVLEGDYVEAGQVVARLVDEDRALDLEEAEAQAEAARAEVGIARAELEAARTDWENPVERQRAVLVTGAALAETEAELDQLPTLVDAEEARLERVREEHKRAENALGSGAVTDLEVIILARAVDAQDAATRALRQREAILTARRDRLRAASEAAHRNFELRVAERKALDAAAARLVRAEAGARYADVHAAEARLAHDRTVIRAPISGYVQRRLKLPGDKVMMAMDSEHSAHIVHIYDPERVQVRVDVPLADASNLFVGQRCEVIVDVLPDTTFAGEVLRITHEADLQKNTLQAKVRVIDPAPILRPEMLTRVKFLPRGGGAGGVAPATRGGAGAGAVLVPEDALRDGSGGAGVWAVRERRGDVGVARLVGVEVGRREGGWAAARGDLRPGDLLIVGGAEPEAGERVRIVRGEGGAS